MTDADPPIPNSYYNLIFSDPNPIHTLNDNKTASNATSATAADYADSFYGPNPPKMLCFGAYKKEEEAISSEITAASFKQMVSQSESSSASSGNNNTNNSGSNPNGKRSGSGHNLVNGSADLVNGVLESKKGRSEKPTVHAKPRTRAKPIGDRIATLHQLVSPFGKTDTSSVLEEAWGYIKFLHDQIQVLSAPFLNLPPNQEGEGLRDRGLCLVPVAYTAGVASENGADYWAPAGMMSSNNMFGIFVGKGDADAGGDGTE